MSLYLLPLVMFLLVCTGCLDLKQPAVKVDYYQIEYGPLNSPASEPLDVVVGVRNFTVAPAYDHDRIVYKEDAFKRQTYYYHRWITNAGAMVKNAILKDLQDSGCYRAVTPIPGGTFWNYEVLGHIHEVSESDLGEDWTTVIDLEVTFIKVPSKESTKKIIFQKNYHHSAVCGKKEPVSVVAAMSAAVKEMSLKFQQD
ncbi:MAG: ABC-type transport auxiliary lipoprotein family protein, partial [Candidatus Brocadiales bacterium]